MMLSNKINIKSILPKHLKFLLIKLYVNIKKLLYFLILILLKKKIRLRYYQNKYEILKLISIDDLRTIFPKKIENITDFIIPLYFSNPIFNVQQSQITKLNRIEGFQQFTAILNNVSIIGGSNLIILDNCFTLYDFKKYNKSNKYRYTDEGILYYKNEICLLRKKNSIDSFKKAIFLGGNYSWNYYHLFYELLIKFEQINESGIDLSTPILIDRICIEIPQYYQLCTTLNENKRTLIPIDKNERYNVNQLYYFSCPNFIPPNFTDDKKIRPHDILFSLNSLQYLRNKFLPANSNKKFPKRIFLSRKNASGLRQFNELEVFQVLERYNFIMMHPENHSVHDQINMFSNAELIAGGSGAAFTNIVFCNNNCKILIFSKSELPFSGFSTISTFIGINLTYYTSERKNISTNIHSPFNINISRLVNFISDWIR